MLTYAEGPQKSFSSSVLCRAGEAALSLRFQAGWFSLHALVYKRNRRDFKLAGSQAGFFSLHALVRLFTYLFVGVVVAEAGKKKIVFHRKEKNRLSQKRQT